MPTESLLEAAAMLALRVSLVLGLALAAMPLLRRSPASTRRRVLALALGGALALPALTAVVPAWRVESRASSLRGLVIPERLVDERDAIAPSVTPTHAEIAGAASPAAGASPRRVSLRRAAGVAFATWAIVAAALVLRLGRGVRQARAMVGRAAPAAGWSEAIARAERAVGLRAAVRMTGELDAPAVTGLRRPVILVPRASQEWGSERRFAVLVHEHAHVRQGDCLAQLVAELACALHWFNPLGWAALRRLRVERELAADDAVLNAGARPTSYAEDLLAIAGVGRRARTVPAGALGMAERSPLALRVTAIVSAGRARRPLGRLGGRLLTASAGSVVLAAACATPAPTALPPSLPSLSAAAPGAPETPGAPLAAPGRAGAAETTLDPRLQAIADLELDRVMDTWKGESGAIVALDAATGEVLANAGRERGVRADVAVRRAYITGSTLKAITLTAALEEGVLTPAERFDCGHGAWTYAGETLHDAGSYGLLSVPEMLAVSTNVGFAKVFDRLGGARLSRWLRAFHFGVAPPIEGAVAGEMPPPFAEKSYAGAVTAIGEAMTASPLQIAAAYAALANDGVYVPPTLTRRAGRPAPEAIMKPETARTVVSMLEEAVNGPKATGKLARIAGVRVAGKTGTAGWTRPDGADGVYASFVGFVPLATRRVVVLVGIEQPRDEGTGASVAAPAFARVMSRLLGG